jgi:hypothetical protein
MTHHLRTIPSKLSHDRPQPLDVFIGHRCAEMLNKKVATGDAMLPAHELASDTG